MPNTVINLSSKTTMSRMTTHSSNNCSVGLGGESFTVTCFTCGMPSSKEWAQRVQSHFTGNDGPYYPFLLQMNHPPHGSHLYEDGSTFLCAFCHASLEYQWTNYEKSFPSTHPKDRHYNLQDFVCSVCSVETYRKRVRALPFQEFPFLAKERPVGSLTLGNNPLAIVCLDCSETLWAQSAEYDRWGLPIQKRHFNWMQRPPPPENSMEATVARLPSGETQLPRCPPTEPEVLPRRKTSNVPLSDLNILPLSCQNKRLSHCRTTSESSNSSSGTTNTINRSPSLHSSVSHHHHHQSHRKTSGSSSGSNGESLSSSTACSLPSSSVPVVTVAPMSVPITTTTSSSLRKGSSSSPNYVPGLNKYLPNNRQQSADTFGQGSMGNLFPDSNSGPGNQTHLNYANFPWNGSRESLEQLRYPFGTPDIGSPWPWLPPPSDLLRYQAYLSSFPSRSMPMPSMDCYYPGPPQLFPTLTNSSNATNFHVQDFHTEPMSICNSSSTGSTLERNPNPKRSPPSPVKSLPSQPEIQSSPETQNSKAKNQIAQQAKRNSLTKLNLVPRTIGKFYTNPKKGLTKNHALSLLAEKSKSSRKTSMFEPYETKRSPSPSIDINMSSSMNSYRRASEPSLLFPQQRDKSSPKVLSPLTISSMPEEPSISKSTDAIVGSSSFTSAPSSLSTESAKRKKSFTIAYLCSENLSPSSNDKIETPAPIKTNSTVSSPISENHLPQPDQTGPIQNEDEFVLKALEDYRKKKIDNDKKIAKEFEEKKNFLGLFNLITNEKKSELELENLVKRAENKCLPPILIVPPEATVASKDEKTLNDEFDKNLFMTCFQGKFNPPDDPEMIEFLKGLNLKPTTKFEKYRREQEWRIILSERIHRERRGFDFCGKKRPWNYEDYDPDKLSSYLTNSATGRVGSNVIKRRHSVPPVNSSFPLMRSLSVSLPPNKFESCSSILHHSTDLLTTVSSNDSTSVSKKEPVISYPKYVPSYATSVNIDTSASIPELGEKHEKSSSILNVPVIQKSEENYKKIQANPICIPKIPIINFDATGRAGKKIPLESSFSRTIIGNSNQNRNGYSINQWPGVDGIIQNCGSQWKETKEDIEYLIKTGSTIKNNEKLKKRVFSDMRKLRKALSSQQLEMKALVKKLKDT